MEQEKFRVVELQIGSGNRANSRHHGNPFSDFFWKTCPNRPADSLRCLPVTAVRPVLYLDLQSNYTRFLHFVPFCFFRWRTTVSCFSSIDRFQLVCFAKVAACPPYLEDALPLCRLRRHSCPALLSALLTFSHAVGNHPHRGESPSPS